MKLTAKQIGAIVEKKKAVTAPVNTPEQPTNKTKSSYTPPSVNYTVLVAEAPKHLARRSDGSKFTIVGVIVAGWKNSNPVPLQQNGEHDFEVGSTLQVTGKLIRQKNWIGSRGNNVGKTMRGSLKIIASETAEIAA